MRAGTIKQPSAKQRFILRLMIVVGACSMVFFLNSILHTQIIGNRWLYYLLISTFIYTFFKIIYEWYHYWAISVPAALPITRTYTVDIFTTFCAGEPYEMIVETLKACKAITYPHETYLCDEADDAYLKQVCLELGVHHVTRKEKINAKAGNINNALSQSSGELCVVLDPDHIPVPEFLDPIVAHFDDPGISYVQVVQAYYNQDTGWIAKGAAQQTYQYYGPMMMTMNSYGTVQAIGANCTFRRTALDSIGGHAAGLAEDMHTAMQLHAKGWRSMYVPEVVTRGLVPATLSAYYKQQLKWSRGVFELLVTSYVKLFKQFSWRQKLHYGLIPMFYLSGFIFLLNFLIPVVSLFADTYPLRMDFSDFIFISIPFITSVVLIRHYVQQWVMEDNERGFHIVGGLLLIGTWWVFILGFFYTIIRKNVPYIPTPKDDQEERNLGINMPNIIVLFISIAAIVYGLYNDWNPFTFFMAGIVSLNCLFMIFMLIASQELKFKAYTRRYSRLAAFSGKIKTAKERFWLLRRKVYTGVRSISLMLFVLIICSSLYASTEHGENNTLSAAIDLLGSYFPALSNNKPFVAKSDAKPGPELFKDLQSLNLQAKTKDTANTDTTFIKPAYFMNIRGVAYSKTQYWYRNIYPLTKKVIEKDFAEMKKAGVNTIKLYGPNVYNRLTFDAANRYNLKIDYSFWVADPSYFMNDENYLSDLKKTILASVERNRSYSAITSWNLGNSTFQKLGEHYHGNELIQAQANYIGWLKQLVQDIKTTDPSRTVTADVLLSRQTAPLVNLLHKQIPGIDAFGLIVPDKAALRNHLNKIYAPVYFSSANPAAFAGADYPSGGIFFANWQDMQAGSTVTFSGLKDIWGRNKPYLSQISAAWHNKPAPKNLPFIKILRPALTTTPGATLQYQALVYLYDKWNLAAYLPSSLKFEWYLVKTDKLGNTTEIEHVSDGPVLNLAIPSKPDHYKLYLVGAKGNKVSDAYSTLNIPLVN